MGYSDIAGIDCGYEHNLALRSDGTVWTSGDNEFGQLGDGTSTDRSSPGPGPRRSRLGPRPVGVVAADHMQMCPLDPTAQRAGIQQQMDVAAARHA
ncbi:MAG: hypothetical protein ACRD0U_00045 [Acidimicrobiales bacterium]